MLASFLNNWWQDIQIFVRSWSPLLFAAVIALLGICILVLARHIIKYGFSVNSYKKNLTLPIIMVILLSGIIVALSIAY